MTVIGFHCSHEQINPAQLLRDVRHAELAGFTAGMSSDHFSPWSTRQGTVDIATNTVYPWHGVPHQAAPPPPPPAGPPPPLPPRPAHCPPFNVPFFGPSECGGL